MLTCAFCGTTVPTVGDAIAADWIPSYWRGGVEIFDPVCASCVTARLRFDEEFGDYEEVPQP
jgi:hypothetical protein